MRSLRCQISGIVPSRKNVKNTQHFFSKTVVVKIPRTSVSRSFTHCLFLSWSFGIVLWEVATIGMY